MSDSRPGWYDDGAGLGRMRWWDGTRWTEAYLPVERGSALTGPQAPGNQAHVGATPLNAGDEAWVWRIVRWPLKLIFAVGVWCVSEALGWVLKPVGLPIVATLAIGFGFPIVGVVIGARIFRIRGEPVAPQRAWWRMTGRRTLSQVVGVIAAAWTGLALVGLITACVFPGLADSRPIFVCEMVASAIVSFLYLNSAARLRAAENRARQALLSTATRNRSLD